MKLKFDAELEYQKDAIDAVVDLFDGQPINQSTFEINSGRMQMEMFNNLGIANNLLIDDEKILENLKKVQMKNDIAISDSVLDKNFSIEMETGTGKTYVYLRTILELNKNYGFKKFIIVVPSVAIREGTLKNLEITKEHFAALYNKTPFDYFVYDSTKISQLRQFATSNQIQILVINIDAFRKVAFADEKKGNVIHRENDRLSGRRPIEFIQATNPIVIIDEPQSVDNTDKSKEAIKTLNPLCKLRYSATHINPYNLLYRLDPIKAYDLRLVKRIEVSSVVEEENYHNVFIRLDSVDNKNSIKAKLTIHDDSKTGTKDKKVTVKQGDDLSEKTSRQGYENGYIVKNINCSPGEECIEFHSGKIIMLGKAIGGMTDDIMKVQIKTTVQEHFEKELKVKEKGIKVLSLFFIDRVANYRIYDENGSPGKGKIAKWFEEAYKEISSKDRFKNVIPFLASQVHDGYFAQDKKGVLKDTQGNTKDDESVYEKIMKNKEQLLSQEEPLRFIFSHSALKEGWDNPNVFCVCTLNETKSVLKKRQEIGRGLRLPVNKDGFRVYDDSINRLTVIANESYNDFAKKLQTEMEEDFCMKFGRVLESSFVKIKKNICGEEKEIGQEQSVKLWEELKENGYIDENGDIQDKFDPDKTGFLLEVSPEFEEIKFKVVDLMKSYLFKDRIVNKRDRKKLNINKRVYLNPEFKSLWDKIKHKTTYSVEYSTEELIKKSVQNINEMEKIKPAKVLISKVSLDIEKSGIETKQLKAGETYVGQSVFMPDILTYLQRETELTRKTLVETLKRSKRLEDFLVNPQKFMHTVSVQIKRALNEQISHGIKYEKIEGQYYEMKLFEDREIAGYLNNLIESQKSVYDNIMYDSALEKRFAEVFEQREDVKLFVKLPSWFKIDTPVGTYNPDWAYVKKDESNLYLIAETKGTKDEEELRGSESKKIKCGKMHFAALDGVEYRHVTSPDEI